MDERQSTPYRSVVEAYSPTIIVFFFCVVLFMLVLGIVGTFLVDAKSLSTLVAGILFLIAFVFFIVFRQIIMEIHPEEIALSWGTEKVWIPRDKITEVVEFNMTPGRRFSASLSLGPWGASGKEKINYFGEKEPMILISTSEGKSYAVSVKNTKEVLEYLK